LRHPGLYSLKGATMKASLRAGNPREIAESIRDFMKR
jgi:hypothetical protein